MSRIELPVVLKDLEPEERLRVLLVVLRLIRASGYHRERHGVQWLSHVRRWGQGKNRREVYQARFGLKEEE